MALKAIEDYNLPTSQTLKRTLDIIQEGNNEFDKILKKSKMKKGTASVLLGVLEELGAITITPTKKDARKKNYEINIPGIKKIFINWVSEKNELTGFSENPSKKVILLLGEEPFFNRHFDNFFFQFPFDTLEQQFYAFIYVHSKVVDKMAKRKKFFSSKMIDEMVAVRNYLDSSITGLSEREIEQLSEEIYFFVKTPQYIVLD